MKDNEKYLKLFNDILIFIIGIVLAKAIQFFLMPLYTSYMTTEAYGVAELINSFSEFLYPIVTLCIYESAFRFAVETDYNNHRLATLIVKMMMVSMLIGGIIAIIGYSIFHYQYTSYLFWIVYIYSLRNCVAYYVRGCGLSKVFALSGVVNALCLALFSWILIVVLHKGVEGYLVAITIAYGISALYLVVASKFFSQIKFKSYRLNELKIILDYAMPLIPYNILYWITMISERYILLYFTDVSTTGIYVAAVKIGAIINMIQSAVYSAFQLNSAREYHKDDKEEYYNTVNNSFIALYFVLGSIVVCFNPILTDITLKRDFEIAGQYLPLIMMAAIFNCISSLISTMYTTYKMTKKMIPVSVIGALSNVLFSVILIPQFEIWGACIAGVVSYFLQVLYKLFNTRSSFGLRYNMRIFGINVVLLLFQVIFASIDNIQSYVISIGCAICLILINMYTYKIELKRIFKYCNCAVNKLSYK